VHLFSIQGKTLRRNVKQFRTGLVFKAHRLLYHSTPGSRVIKKKKKKKHLGRRLDSDETSREVTDLLLLLYSRYRFWKVLAP